MLQMCHLTPDRPPSDLKLFTPMRTQATQAESFLKSAYSNGSSCQFQTPRILINQTPPGEDYSALSHHPQIVYQNIDEVLKAMKLVAFLSNQIKQKNGVIVQKTNNIRILKLQREELEYQIGKSRKSYYSRQKTLSKHKEKRAEQKEQKEMSIDSQISILKHKIKRMKSLCSQNDLSHLSGRDRSSVGMYFAEDNKQKYPKRHRKLYNQTDIHRSRLGKERKKRVYVPMCYPNYCMPVQNHQQYNQNPAYYHENHQYHHVKGSHSNYPPQTRQRNYTDYQSHRPLSTEPNQVVYQSDILRNQQEESFTRKMNIFNQKLQGSLTKKNSELEYSVSKKSRKSSSIRDKGSYIYPSLITSKSGSENSKIRLRQDSFKVFSEDEKQPELKSVPPQSNQTPSTFKFTISHTHDERLTEYPHLKKRKTDGKGSGIPIIQQINNSTVYVEVPGQRRQNSSFQRSMEKKQNESSKSSDRKITYEQSTVQMDTKILAMLENSPIKEEESSLSESPLRIWDRDQKLGESVAGDGSFQIKIIERPNSKVMSNGSSRPIISNGSYIYNAEPSISSRYQDTPRRKAESDEKPRRQQARQQTSHLNLLEVINIHPIPKLPQKQQVQQDEDEDDDDILNTIRLSTESIFSRQKTHKSTGSYIKNSSVPEIQMAMVSVSDIKDSKKTKKDKNEDKDPKGDQLDGMEELRSTTPSRILKKNLVKHKFKGGSELMSSSIVEVNEEQEEALSSKKIISPRKSKEDKCKQ